MKRVRVAVYRGPSPAVWMVQDEGLSKTPLAMHAPFALRGVTFLVKPDELDRARDRLRPDNGHAFAIGRLVDDAWSGGVLLRYRTDWGEFRRDDTLEAVTFCPVVRFLSDGAWLIFS